ncbi:MAG: 16S rRNA (cytidine(1402)-2'-O)-methyltransferase [Clostridiales bacterium]|jgi:16S rRNA (cytidine1402-2'-O)-methyltransferase|nr:16S rRNA (cytidine(1402)-2'-O)-methyltransferase [Clostridiales bacterium]
MSGTLYAVGTPLGNLEDISLRAIRILKESDCIAAEDTRQTLKLLNRYDIKTHLTSFHEHNQKEKAQDLIRQLSQGRTIALVTDAGMPGISDPGQDLIRMCHESSIPVSVIPGPTAATTALTLSGLASERFVFYGFLPRGSKQRKAILDEIAGEYKTAILYESPHHLLRTLEDLKMAIGARPAAVIRELTKIHEELIRGNIDDLVSHFKETEPRGEIVIILEGETDESRHLATPKKSVGSLQSLSIEEHMAFYLKDGLDRKSAMKLTARDRGVPKSEIYSALLESGDNSDGSSG